MTSIRKRKPADTAVTTRQADVAADAPKKSAARWKADLAMQPSFNAAAVAIEYLSKPGGELSVTSMMDSLTDSIEELRASDMSRAEAMLFAQAHALQSIFVELARRAARDERPDHREASLRMALKAQNQCRMTLETLATVKNPPVVIARQANISHGPQQVNNHAAPRGTGRTRTHAGNRRNRQNELLEASDEQGVDFGAASSAGSADVHIETVAPINRPAHR